MRLMIVDDDDQIREGMVFGIQWENLGIDQVEGRKNGKEVLEALETAYYDVIVSDISMPVMSGIDLMRLVHEKYPEIHFILISGYREFEYAQAGIRYGADAYILKPIHLDELLKTVSEVLEKIRRTQKEHENQTIVDQVYKNQYIRKYIRNREIDGKKITSFLKEKCGFERIHALVAFVLQDDQRSGSLELNPSLKQQVINTITEYLAGYTYTYFLMDSNELFLLVDVADSTLLVMNLKQQFKRMLGDINRDMKNGSFSAGVSHIGYGSDFTLLYENAKRALNEGFFLGKGICAEGEAYDKRDKNYLEETGRQWTKQLIHAITQSDEDELTRITEECQKKMNVCSKEEIQKFLIQNTGEIYRECNVSFQDSDLQKAIFEAETYAELMTMWKQTITAVLHEKKEENKYSRDINQAIRYIREHYKERISAEQIADHLGISAGHFSRIFKQQVGIPFVKYLNQYRIEKAQELLSRTNLRIYEVAEQVGFSDYLYFTQVFRNLTGKSPKDMRK